MADSAQHGSTSSRRYLGGQALDPASNSALLWFNTAALCMLLIALIGILFSFADQLGDRLLVTGYVLETESSEFSPLPYIAADLERLERAEGFLKSPAEDFPPINNLMTAADFERLLSEVLPVVSHDTLILVIRCHSFTTDAGIFLQPVDADPTRPESGISVRRLLDAAIACPAENRLILLDIAPCRTDLQLGIAAQTTAERLRSDFEDLQKSGVSVGNTLVMLAADSMQSSGPIHAERLSAFSMFAAYALSGGPEVDQTGIEDGILTASELATFVERSVADWSLRYQGVLQHPFSLQAGDDFPIAAASELLTLTAWTQAASADEGTTDDENADEEEQEPQAADGGEIAEATQARPTDPTPENVLEQIRQLWVNHNELQETDVPTRRARHWVLFAQQLQRAEQELLAGNTGTAQQLISEDLTSLQKELSAPLQDSIQYSWSAAFRDLQPNDEAVNKSREDLQSALSEPTARQLNRIADSPFVEATFVRQIAPSMTSEEGLWEDLELLSDAIAVRELAEETARLTARSGGADEPLVSVPWLLPFVRTDIEAADSVRVAAEQALRLQRRTEAAAQFELARRKYRDIRKKAERLAHQIHEVHLMAMDSAGVLQWLASDVPSDITAMRCRLLNAVMQGTQELTQQPDEALLSSLLTLVHDIRREVSVAVRDALLRPTTYRKSALLHVPFLHASDRMQLLNQIIDANDRPRLREPHPRFTAIETSDHAPSRTSLTELLVAMNVPVPSTGTTDLRRALNEIRTDPVALPPLTDAGVWAAWMHHLYRAPFQSELLRQTRYKPVVTNAALGRMTVEHLRWQLRRLHANQLVFPGSYGGPRQQLVDSIQALDPSYVSSESADDVPLVARIIGATASEDGRYTDIRYEIRSGSGRLSAASGELVIDYYGQRTSLQIQSVTNLKTGESVGPVTGRGKSNAPVAGERVTPDDAYRFTIPISWGEPARIAVRVSIPGKDVRTLADMRLPPLSAWVEADEAVWAMPLSLRLESDKSRDFEIRLAGPDAKPIERPVEVFPNEAYATGLSILNRRAEAVDADLRIHSGDAYLSWPVTIAPGPQHVPLMPDEDGTLEIIEGRFEVRLSELGEVVASREFEVGVQNPAAGFQPAVEYDTEKLHVTTTIRRLLNSDARRSVAVAMEVVGAELTEGKLEATLGVDEESTSIDATIVEDADLAKFTVEVGVAGVERLFRFRVNAVTGAVEQLRSTGIRIAAPAEAAVYLSGKGQRTVDIGLAVDSSGECEVRLGIDRNGNDYLESSERLTGGRFWRGRRVETQMVASAEAGTLTLTSQVSDLSLPVEASGVAGRQRILAQLLAGGRSLGAAKTIYFVDRTPPMTFRMPGNNARIARGAPFKVSVSSDPILFPVIEDVEVGVDRNGNGKWDEDETLTPVDPPGSGTLRFAGSNEAFAAFDSDVLLSKEEPEPPPSDAEAPNEAPAQAVPVILMARAVRRLAVDEDAERPARTGDIIRRTVVLTDPEDVPPETGRITGKVVTADGVGQRNVVVTIGENQTQTDDAGVFEFSSIPVGTHVIATDTPRRAGSAEVEVKAGETATANVQLQLR